MSGEENKDKNKESQAQGATGPNDAGGASGSSDSSKEKSKGKDASKDSKQKYKLICTVVGKSKDLKAGLILDEKHEHFDYLKDKKLIQKA